LIPEGETGIVSPSRRISSSNEVGWKDEYGGRFAVCTPELTTKDSYDPSKTRYVLHGLGHALGLALESHHENWENIMYESINSDMKLEFNEEQEQDILSENPWIY